MGLPIVSVMARRLWALALTVLLFSPALAFAEPLDHSPSASSAQSASGAMKSETPSVVVDKGVGTDAPSSGSLRIPDAPQDFVIHGENGWLKIAYHPSLAAKVRMLVDEADSAKAELIEKLGVPVLKNVTVRVGRTAGEMETLAPVGTRFPKYASGVAYSELGLVLLTATSRFPNERFDLKEVFRHELAHIALHDAVSRDKIPRWFNEGFAVFASGEAESSRLQALWTASLSGNLLPFSRLTRSFPADAQTASVAYAQAADLLRFLLRSGEEHRFSALIRRISGGQTFEKALGDAYSTDMYTLERQWREDVARRYTFWPVIFGGSLIWVFALGLLAWGWARRRGRAQQKLARWAREEALEDAKRDWAKTVLARMSAKFDRAHPPEREEPQPEHREKAVNFVARPVPSVEHEGERHTLH